MKKLNRKINFSIEVIFLLLVQEVIYEEQSLMKISGSKCHKIEILRVKQRWKLDIIYSSWRALWARYLGNRASKKLLLKKSK